MHHIVRSKATNKVPLIVGLLLSLKSRLVNMLVRHLHFFRFVQETRDYKQPITFDVWFKHKVLGPHRHCYWPIHPTTCVTEADNVFLGVETFPGYMPGCYIQAIGRVEIGDHTILSANVGIISSNHSLVDSREHVIQTVHIGSYCWIGMNSVILPGVHLGDHTVVGAGAVVTTSFPDGHCVLAGIPARRIRDIPRSECVKYSVSHRYHGYLSEVEYSARLKRIAHEQRT